MTTASDGVALVATHLAHTDRRALSEAWYSALHVASADRGAVRTRATGCGTSAFVQRSPNAVRADRADRTLQSCPPAAAAWRARANAAPNQGERRRPACEVARRVERAVARLAAVPKRRAGAQTIDVAGGRIRLLVRNDGGATRVIALCPAPLRERVERALAHARFTLAASGMTVAR